MERQELKRRAFELRERGFSYKQISQELGQDFPKSTLSHWFRGLEMPKVYKDAVRHNNLIHLQFSRAKAMEAKSLVREKYLSGVHDNYKYLPLLLQNEDTALLVLATLHWAEGGKQRSHLQFANSDVSMLKLYIKLLEICFKIDRSKIRLTVQCRYDQDTVVLMDYWSKEIGVPLSQFYRPFIDQRTEGKPTQKQDYKGVCRMDYGSADIETRLAEIAKIIGL